MCSPELAGVAMMGSTGVSAGAQLAAGFSNAKMSKANAGLAEAAAVDALARGADEESRYRMNIRQVQGRQRAAVAASGLTFSGSAAEIARDTDMIAEQDVATIRANAAREAFGFRTQASTYRYQGRLDKRGAVTGAAGTFLGGAARSYEIWDR